MCGQPDKSLDPTLHDLLHEFLHEFVHLDGKIVSTLKLLLFYPGRLSIEFLEGKRARQIGPVRLYLTTSLIFFLLAAHSGAKSKVQVMDKKDIDEIHQELKSEGEQHTTRKHWKDRIFHAADHPDEFEHAFLSNISRVMFLIVPLFALGLRIAYHNRKYHYPGFVYFSLHYHSFLFLALSLYLLAGFTKWSFLEMLIDWTVTIAVPLYLFLAQRRVFGGSKRKTVLRMACLAMVYFPCLVAGVALAATATLLTMSN